MIKLNIYLLLQEIFENTFFDPLGHLQLIVLHYKLLFQKLWKMKLNWDIEIPSDLIKEWNDLLQFLNN